MTTNADCLFCVQIMCHHNDFCKLQAIVWIVLDCSVGNFALGQFLESNITNSVQNGARFQCKWLVTLQCTGVWAVKYTKLCSLLVNAANDIQVSYSRMLSPFCKFWTSFSISWFGLKMQLPLLYLGCKTAFADFQVPSFILFYKCDCTW